MNFWRKTENIACLYGLKPTLHKCTKKEEHHQKIADTSPP
jgi:hypothetical protein